MATNKPTLKRNCNKKNKIQLFQAVHLVEMPAYKQAILTPHEQEFPTNSLNFLAVFLVIRS